ncbi:MAG: threonine--tRNA ligase [Patescibacteria group bacterium]
MSKSDIQNNNLEIMRHSAAHVLAAAVQKLYPAAKFAIGPAIEKGFYYDFDFPKPVSEEELPKIEQEMKKIKKETVPFEKEEIPIEKARDIFSDQPYKLELINQLKKEEELIDSDKVTIYKTGDFVDLCRGPHVEDTSQIGAFKLHKIAGAYWRGDENNPMLTRIYGIAFETQEELQEHLEMLRKAEERDHRKIGQEMDLFSFHPQAAPGDAFWHPKGYTIIKELIRYWRDVHRRENYVEVRTPEILTKKIWEQSGHTTSFLEKMYKISTQDDKVWDMAVKPMNCDGGILIYKNKNHSYRDLPLRMGELGVVHRYEGSGELHGILRPREFTQDDAHIYCTPEQVKEELKKIIELCFEVYETCGLELDHLELSTRPENSIGSDKIWEKAEQTMKVTLEESKIKHKINAGDGAFYGPKIDFHLKDSLGRTWQCATIQLDFAQPENFELEYVDENGERKRPVMIHRTIYGSLERFTGILMENYAGNFPLWLAPIQAIIIPISENQINYAQEVKEKLLEIKNPTEKFRVKIDQTNQTLEKKIRNAETQRVPYMLIVGSREEGVGNEVSVRIRDGGDLGTMKIENLINKLQEKITNKSLTLDF